MALAPARASFRFYAELKGHLPPSQRYPTVEHDFFVPTSVKDMIECFGVPHTEVDLILVNGESSQTSLAWCRTAIASQSIRFSNRWISLRSCASFRRS